MALKGLHLAGCFLHAALCSAQVCSAGAAGAGCERSKQMASVRWAERAAQKGAPTLGLPCTPGAASNPGYLLCPVSTVLMHLMTLSTRRPSQLPQGVDLGLRCLAAAGATTVMTLLNSPAGRFTFEGTGDRAGAAAAAAGGAADGAAQPGEPGSGGASGPDGAVPAGHAAAFEHFLADVARTGPVPLQMPLFSAHQMGTCRLGECGIVHDSRFWLKSRGCLLGSRLP